MKNRKAAISIEMIVYVAIAVFVLVIVIGFATGAFQKLIPAFTRDDVKEAKDTCKIDCNDAKASLQTDGITAWKNSRYCTVTHAIKTDQGSQLYGCWQAPITQACEDFTLVAGKTWKCAVLGADTEAGFCECWDTSGVAPE